MNQLLWLNALTAIGMSTCVFTGQIKMIWNIWGMELIFPASNIVFALLTFPVTDLIADVFGKKEANRTVWIGFISQLLTISIIELCMLLPGESSALAPFHVGGWLVFIGSSIAYLVAQFWDVYIFHWIKENWTGDKHLWIRNNVSTCSSQLINSTIFLFFVFGWEGLTGMLAASMAVKWTIALIDTPFVYLGRGLLKSQISYNQSYI